jgi:hypothetical protein
MSPLATQSLACVFDSPVSYYRVVDCCDFIAYFRNEPPRCSLCCSRGQSFPCCDLLAPLILSTAEHSALLILAVPILLYRTATCSVVDQRCCTVRHASFASYVHPRSRCFDLASSSHCLWKGPPSEKFASPRKPLSCVRWHGYGKAQTLSMAPYTVLVPSRCTLRCSRDPFLADRVP